jgi:hypothetical protein
MKICDKKVYMNLPKTLYNSTRFAFANQKFILFDYLPEVKNL